MGFKETDTTKVYKGTGTATNFGEPRTAKGFGTNHFEEPGLAKAFGANDFGTAKKFDAKSLGANDFKEIYTKRNPESNVPTEVLQKISEVRSPPSGFKQTGTAKSF